MQVNKGRAWNQPILHLVSFPPRTSRLMYFEILLGHLQLLQIVFDPGLREIAWHELVAQNVKDLQFVFFERNIKNQLHFKLRHLFCKIPTCRQIEYRFLVQYIHKMLDITVIVIQEMTFGQRYEVHSGYFRDCVQIQLEIIQWHACNRYARIKTK